MPAGGSAAIRVRVQNPAALQPHVGVDDARRAVRFEKMAVIQHRHHVIAGAPTMIGTIARTLQETHRTVGSDFGARSRVGGHGCQRRPRPAPWEVLSTRQRTSSR
jgi:hypothetical protein